DQQDSKLQASQSEPQEADLRTFSKLTFKTLSKLTFKTFSKLTFKTFSKLTFRTLSRLTFKPPSDPQPANLFKACPEGSKYKVQGINIAPRRK
ncbi:hypothetical protein E4U41_007303, partial [Claviceps citrina]